jgi:hypothetical protein
LAGAPLKKAELATAGIDDQGNLPGLAKKVAVNE